MKNKSTIPLLAYILKLKPVPCDGNIDPVISLLAPR